MLARLYLVSLVCPTVWASAVFSNKLLIRLQDIVETANQLNDTNNDMKTTIANQKAIIEEMNNTNHDLKAIIEEMNNTNHDLKREVAKQKAIIADSNATVVDLMIKMAELNSTIAKQKGKNYSILMLSY